MWELSLWPETASTFANRVDQVYIVLSLLAVLVAVPVAGLIVYFAFKYRRGSPADRSGAPPTSHTLETVWIAVPLVVLLGIFGWSAGL
jgi:cytochrome c oxidase subunit 2